MHVGMSTTADTALAVTVSEPRAGDDGHVFGPDVEVRPFGIGGPGGVFWSLSLDEARELAAKLAGAVAEAEQLFPPR